MSFDSNLSVRAPFLRAFTMSMYTTLGDFGSRSQKLLPRSVLAIFLASGHLPCMSEGSEVKGAAPKVEQRWEMLEPAPEMRARFPMCDKFLRVAWLDEDKEVGYATFETLLNGKPNGNNKAALVYLDLVYPRFDLDISQWWEGKKLDELARIIKKAGVLVHPDNATEVDFAVPGTNLGAPLTRYTDVTLDQNRSNVCIPFPPKKSQGNNQYLRADRIHFRKSFVHSERPTAEADAAHPWMWIAEFKTPAGMALSDEAVQRIYGELLGRNCGILDMNREGRFDCVGHQSVLYRHGSKYFEMEWSFDVKRDAGTPQYGLVRFPPGNQTCTIFDPLDQYFITDGERVYLDNTCNLTDVAR